MNFIDDVALPGPGERPAPGVAALVLARLR
jgi:hypothetical protein